MAAEPKFSRLMIGGKPSAFFADLLLNKIKPFASGAQAGADGKIRFRLQNKLLLSILLLQAILITAVVLVVEHQTRDSIMTEFLKRGRLVTKNLAALNNDFLANYHYVKIEQNLSHVVEENELLYAAIVLFDGEIVAYEGQANYRQQFRELSQKKTSTIDEVFIQNANLGTEEFCNIAVPIFLKDEYWGVVYTGFSLKDVQVAIARTRQSLLLLGIVSLLLGWVASVILARRITRPVNELVESVYAVASGEYDYPIKVNSRDEIGYLGHCFGAMQEALKTQFNMLEDGHRQLVASNKELQYEIKQRQKREIELRESEARLANAQRLAKLGFWEWDRTSNRLLCSAEMADLVDKKLCQSNTQYDDFLAFIHIDDKPLFENIVQRVIDSRERCSLQNRICFADGRERFVHQEIEASFDQRKEAYRIVGTLQDITDQKHAEQRIRYLAYYDNVTGLPNRGLLIENLQFWLQQARQQGGFVAVLFLDLDLFKRVNDTLGHAIGDLLLREVSSRLLNSVQQCGYIVCDRLIIDHLHTDFANNSMIARLGGDEFVVILTETRRLQHTNLVARGINQALSAPFRIGGHQVFVSASIGISDYPNDADNTETLLKQADMAMYHAKQKGRNRYQFYNETMNNDVQERLAIETHMRDSLEQFDHFFLHYQPKIDAESKQISGMEALLRWQHPQLGFVAPDKFIPVAEETGLIIPLGEWVLRTACLQAKTWQDMGLAPLQVSVNLSAAQFLDGGLHDVVAYVLRESQLDPGSLELELTESLLMDNLEVSVEYLHKLKALGIQLSIDDFGTGYSSLSYLKRFPIDALKIDRSFVHEITTDANDAAIVAATIALGHSLQLKVVAEGVETATQYEMLRNYKCDEIQGYFFSRPLPEHEFFKYALTQTNQ